MTAPFRGSGPWRGRGPFLGRGPWAGKAPFGFNAGLPFQISVTGAQLRDALNDPTAWGTTGSATGWLLPGLGGARLSGDCRTSVAMQTEADGTVGYAAHNLLTYSADFSNAAWSKSGVTVATDNAVAPDGTLTADTISAAGTALNAVFRNYTGSLNPGATTAFIYAKAGTKSIVQFAANAALTGTADSRANFDLANGVLGSVDTGTLSASITSVGNGWYRCAVTWTRVGSSSANGIWSMQDTTSAAREASSTAGTMSLWGAQLNLGSVALPYVPTTAAARFGPAIDWLSGIGSYGIRSESARTNLVTYSTDLTNADWEKGDTTVSANQGVAPDGTTTADLLYPTTTGLSRYVWRPVSLLTAAAQAITASWYVKASSWTWVMVNVEGSSNGVWFNIAAGTVGTASAGYSGTITSVGNGWYRTTSTTTRTGTVQPTLRVCDADNSLTATTSGTSGVLLWGAQCESGTEASSPILTYAAAATRAADTLVVLDSGWLSQTAGTLAADYVPRVAGTQLIAELDDATANERLSLTNDGIFTVIDGGVSQAAVDGGTPTAAALNKVAASYAANAFAVSLNNGAVVTDTAGTLPTVTRMDLNALDGHITRMRYSRRRANEGTLRSLST